MDNYIFYCNYCKQVCLTDEDIDKHIDCNTTSSEKYWSEDYILNNIEEFIELAELRIKTKNSMIYQ